MGRQNERQISTDVERATDKDNTREGDRETKGGEEERDRERKRGEEEQKRRGREKEERKNEGKTGRVKVTESVRVR